MILNSFVHNVFCLCSMCEQVVAEASLEYNRPSFPNQTPQSTVQTPQALNNYVPSPVPNLHSDGYDSLSNGAPPPKLVAPLIRRVRRRPKPETPPLDPNSTKLLVVRNTLQENIDRDISKAAEGVTMVTKNESENEGAPLDPNLICPKCMKQYHLGEIQLYRAHAGQCDGTRHDTVSTPYV